MNEESTNNALKKLHDDFLNRREKSPADLDALTEEHMKIIESSQKYRAWNAYLQQDLWKLRKAVDLISQAYHDWKNKIGGFLQIGPIWDPAEPSLEAYKEALLILAIGSIKAEQLEASFISEEDDYWIRPFNFLGWCRNKGIVLPASYETFHVVESLRLVVDDMSLQFANQISLDVSNRRKKLLGTSLQQNELKNTKRRDARQMDEFLKAVKKVRAEFPKLEVSKILKRPEIVRARERFTRADGSHKPMSNSYLKRLISKIPSHPDACKPGRRKGAKS